MADIYIYEDTFRCHDCESGNSTHNTFHLPHTQFSFSFNTPDPDFDQETFSSHVLAETWNIDELREMMGEANTFSWTQLAIARCQELER